MTIEDFLAVVDVWAKSNGYKSLGNLWRNDKHYLTIAYRDGMWVCQATQYRTGKILCDMVVRKATREDRKNG